MEMAKIVLGNDEDTAETIDSLTQQINHCVAKLHMQVGKNLYKVATDGKAIQITANLPDFRLDRDAPTFYKKLSECLSRWITTTIEPQLLRTYIREQGYAGEDIESIVRYCELVLNQQDYPQLHLDWTERRDRRQRIAATLMTCLETNTYLNIDGLFQFRMQNYTAELKDVVDYAVDEYIMEQQYQEFIHLLKYFVLLQESKIPEVHIVHQPDQPGEQFQITNEIGESIPISDWDSFVVETVDQDIRFEDMIISTLISVAPEKIIIHSREPEMQAIKTIEQIFEDRTALCTYCSVCHPYLGGKPLDRQENPIYNNEV